MEHRPNPRTESDFLGEIDVPAAHYWGAQTQRALQNFRIGAELVPPQLVESLGILKLAAARTNMELGLLDVRLGDAICRSAREVADGELMSEFPLSVWQSGSGTQTNMNANEVIAGRANEILSGNRRGKAPIHPNDHCNMSQSTNDTFPVLRQDKLARIV